MDNASRARLSRDITRCHWHFLLQRDCFMVERFLKRLSPRDVDLAVSLNAGNGNIGRTASMIILNANSSDRECEKTSRGCSVSCRKASSEEFWTSNTRYHAWPYASTTGWRQCCWCRVPSLKCKEAHDLLVPCLVIVHSRIIQPICLTTKVLYVTRRVPSSPC